MNVLFVVPYPVGKAASQRFRVEQFLPLLQDQGIKYKVAPFWDKATYTILYQQGHTLQKIAGTLNSFLSRMALLAQILKYDYVFVHREATPVGPPWWEWLAAKVFKQRLIFDFDDAIWLENTSDENRTAAKYKQLSKTSKICAWSYRVSVGNSFLKSYAAQYNPHVVYLPTTVDLKKYNRIKDQETNKVVIGWTGSHSTLPYLKIIEPVLQELEQQYSFEFVVIADKAPNLHIRSLRFVPWHAETEIQDLLQFNIGVMPLPDTEWAKGKCAFKALQYMALGIPAVVSAVGANTEAVPNGEAGYTCATEQEWYKCLEQLLLNPSLRREMGAVGNAWVAQKYSLAAHKQSFLRLFT
ncbi:glycosyltransferase family 4 protein [Pontibacter cellulosilyticus]|uniref:Glycosyltransferase family 4 protein n=1 Tax=Pontibacter cellulosilyticus TaxID=1720253 RepID=A0A923SJ77_9BACT|nr:glycosyltransferase family 4 protein [Pontibacter cellulosilyticus]MBC5993609.1 glycosyltransferase family 4 protein [Pontibacter cellulosilyticus]